MNSYVLPFSMGYIHQQHKKQTLNLKLPFITHNNKYKVEIHKNKNNKNEAL